MHNLLQLKGEFTSLRAPNKKPGPRILPKGQKLSVSHMTELIKELRQIYDYWNLHPSIGGALVSVHYRQVIAKSNRLHRLLKDKSILPDESIRGSRFERDSEGHIRNHVFTHFVSLNAISSTIRDMEKVAQYILKQFNGVITSEDTKKISFMKSGAFDLVLKKTPFLDVVVDCYYVKSFCLDSFKPSTGKQSIVTIYRTGKDTVSLLSDYGIQIDTSKIIGDYTLLLNPDQIERLQERAPYLISMSVVDMKDIPPETSDNGSLDSIDTLGLPSPGSEPVIGVIDTQFNEKVYFHEWVDYTNMLNSSIPLTAEDYLHGTAVSSIIVDGPRGNPKLEDHCGHFRVRHVGVATSIGFSSFNILRLIREIIASNRDIRVWNLSLGSIEESNQDFISPEAAELDRIQNEYDVIFVVAGTNKMESFNGDERIGAPADSLNAIVVNSVSFEKSPASYSRVGPVLSFFHKPDFSYYGGDGLTAKDKIVVCRDTTGGAFVCGTSFAAPWISRKLSYLIDIMGFSKEIAKALLIDAAAGWKSDEQVSNKIGYGIVPVDINEILETEDDEIRFYISGSTHEYETFNYNLPVPRYNDKYPFFARATLTYFPACSREQGVDYTGTELDIHFGRVKETNGKVEIQDIKGNKQSDTGYHFIYEKEAREQYRKWDNVKHISDTITQKGKARKSYGKAQWGIKLVSKERNYMQKRKPMMFGLVITLKEMKGNDRYGDFIKLCSAYGWIVNEIVASNRIETYIKAEEDIDLS